MLYLTLRLPLKIKKAETYSYRVMVSFFCSLPTVFGNLNLSSKLKTSVVTTTGRVVRLCTMGRCTQKPHSGTRSV